MSDEPKIIELQSKNREDVYRAIKTMLADKKEIDSLVMAYTMKDGSTKIVSTPLFHKDRCYLAANIFAWNQSYFNYFDE